jgi:hypothetical protein
MTARIVRRGIIGPIPPALGLGESGRDIDESQVSKIPLV